MVFLYDKTGLGRIWQYLGRLCTCCVAFCGWLVQAGAASQFLLSLDADPFVDDRELHVS